MLHIIYGSDYLARKETFDRLRAELDKDGSLATNTITFEAKTANPQEVIAACDTVPFLGDGRLVVLEGALPAASARARSKPTEPDAEEEEAGAGKWEPLIEYVPRLPATTTLVLLDGAIITTSTLFKALKPHAEVTSCPLPSDRGPGLAKWVTERANSIGLKLGPGVAKQLADLVGPEPLLLASELEKLLAYSGGEVVREDDVRQLVSRAKEHMGWELSAAVIDGKGATAARVLQELLEDGVVAPPLLSTIAGRYRRIAIARDMLARGESSGAIMKRLGIGNPKAYPFLLEEVDRISEQDVREAYARLIQAEMDYKRGSMEGDLALELVVQDLASRARKPASTRR